MSYYRPPLPGTWVEGSVISAEELERLDITRVERTYDPTCRSITLDIRATLPDFAPLIEALKRAKAKIERPAKDECHHCGAPSPGSICRYCNTEHSRST